VDRIVILRVDWPGMEHENLLVEESLVEVLKGWIIFLVVGALNEGNVIDGLDGPPGVTNLALCLLQRLILRSSIDPGVDIGTAGFAECVRVLARASNKRNEEECLHAAQRLAAKLRPA